MEKGGKGFSIPSKGLKSSLKSTPARDGKDDSSAKSKRGRKVQFNSEGDKLDFLSKSGGNFDATTVKGSLSKGGKGDKAPLTKEPQSLELKVEQELPKSAKCLMDCEAAQILLGIQDQMVLLSRDPTIKLPVSFDKALNYAKTGARYTNPQSVRRVLDDPSVVELLTQTLDASKSMVSLMGRYHSLRGLFFQGTEKGVLLLSSKICEIANVCPESVDEVFALVPSLKSKKNKLRQPLKDVLDELAKLKQQT